MPNLYGLILAGGFSKRMGQDKALLSYHGKPQIEYVHELLLVSCEKVFLSKRADQPLYKNIAAIDDLRDFADKGPLGGILSAMKSHPSASWLIMACDLPFVDAKALEYLLSNRNPQQLATAFKSTHDGLPEPLCAVWEGHGYVKVLEFFQQGIQCPRKVLINSDINLLEQANPHWLDNVNNPQEFTDVVNQLKKWH
jgi:molybdopterin-guanine dinucleotide biosynthesis protein A